MTLYARSDLMGVSVPVTSGGCGKTHTRPVVKGVPARDFRLDCPGCEAFLKGGGRQVLTTIPGDKENGIPPSQKRVAAMDPCWGVTPEGVPQTPDEQQYTSKRHKLGAEELEWIRAIAAAKQAGIDLPDAAKEMLAQRLPGFGVVQGEVVCPQGHGNQAGVKFCGECGWNMATKGSISSSGATGARLTAQTEGLAEGVIEKSKTDPRPRTKFNMTGKFPEDVLSKLSIAELKGLCRQQGLPVSGKKSQLVDRLS